MKKILLTLATAIFLVLAATYTFDPGYRRTSRQTEPTGPHTGRDNMLSSLNVTAITQDSLRRIWIGTSAGINVYDGETFTQFFHDTRDTTALPDDYVNVLHTGRDGHLWVGTQNGLARHEGASRFRRFDLPSTDDCITVIADADTSTPAKAVVVRNRSQFFLVADDGRITPLADGRARRLMHKDPNALVTVTDADTLAMNKPRDIVQTVYRDRDNNLWIGYHNAGFQVISDDIRRYALANNNALARATEGRDVTCLSTVGRQILAGTTLRLYVYDTATDRWRQYFYRDLFSDPTATALGIDAPRQELRAVVPLDDRRCWLVGNRRVLGCTLGEASLTVEGGKATPSAPLGTLGSGARIGDHLYVSSNCGALLRYTFGTERPDSIAVPGEWYDDETQLMALGSNRLLLFMRNMHVTVYNTDSHTFTPLHISGDLPYGNVDPAFARIDSRGTVWLGTKRSGLYRLDLHSGRSTRMTSVNDVHVQALVEDRLHQLWVTTIKDAVCYRPTTGEILMNSLVSSSQNDWNRQFFDNAICIAPDGRVVLGSSDGCIFLSPETASAAPQPGLYIYGLETRDADRRTYAINASLSDGSHYTLPHDRSDVTLRFYSPDYGGRPSLMYEYMLEGYDKTWQAPTYRHVARYARLPAGHYTFRLRLVASEDGHTLATRSIGLTVRCAPWQSAAAWMLYAALALLTLYCANTLYLRLRTGRLRLEQEQRTNEMNMSFFANISHEFRNPITIIAGPLMQLLADETLPRHARATLDRICLSVNRMLRLIDQMLDFNQLETDALRLKVCPVDATAELERLATTFADSARVRGIGLDTRVTADDCLAWMDVDKLEKILSNLFTNALKHTPTGGHIVITATTENNQNADTADTAACRRLTISVYNSGSHIAADKMTDVFKRYYQLADTESGHHYGWGTGIGLYYVKRLATLHHGDVTVGNVVREGEAGVEFCVTLPVDREAYTDSETTAETHSVMQLPVGRPSAEETPDNTATEATGKRRILIVDDDTDVAQYIRSVFADTYDVHNRYSAESALTDIEDLNPDIVLSDVVMGEMSGYDLCRRLKDNLSTSHIPVVLITAKSEMKEQIDGLRMGAVAYVTKPFDPFYLRALVESQLSAVKSLRRRLGESTDTQAVADVMADRDREFMDELYASMEKRSTEMDLNVATVCHDMLISPTKFNYKVKELTGDTPGAFFRKYKLNKAAALLREGRLNVAEVAAVTGFGTPSHFSVAFKRQFGVSPSEYK